MVAVMDSTLPMIIIRMMDECERTSKEAILALRREVK